MDISYNKKYDTLYIGLNDKDLVATHLCGCGGVTFENFYDKDNKLIGAQIRSVGENIHPSELKVSGLENLFSLKVKRKKNFPELLRK